MANNPLTFSVMIWNPWTLAKKWLKLIFLESRFFHQYYWIMDEKITFHPGWKHLLIRSESESDWAYVAGLFKKVAHRGVTKRCLLSWLTNSTLVYKPKCEGGGGWIAGSQPMNTAVNKEPKLWRSNSINLWWLSCVQELRLHEPKKHLFIVPTIKEWH